MVCVWIVIKCIFREREIERERERERESERCIHVSLVHHCNVYVYSCMYPYYFCVYDIYLYIVVFLPLNSGLYRASSRVSRRVILSLKYDERQTGKHLSFKLLLPIYTS
jgi:hypothetical protein